MGFSLRLPPGWELNELQGIDSYVGEVVGGGVRLTFDYGGFSWTLDPADDPEHEFSEAELEEAIPAVHYAVLKAHGVLDANTSFDSATGQIRTIVVLESTASDSVVDDLRAIAEKRLIDVTRPDILDSITISVVRSEVPVLGRDESNTNYR